MSDTSPATNGSAPAVKLPGTADGRDPRPSPPPATTTKPVAAAAEGSGRKPGRPRAPAPDDSLPRILSAARSRSTMSVVMGAVTARDLKQYIEWAAGKVNMPATEAMIVVLDQAIGEFLDGDRAWQRYKKEFLDGREGE